MSDAVAFSPAFSPVQRPSTHPARVRRSTTDLPGQNLAGRLQQGWPSPSYPASMRHSSPWRIKTAARRQYGSGVIPWVAFIISRRVGMTLIST